MPEETTLTALAVTAVTLGFVHTLIGPDHYLPFIVMSKARKWSLAKTSWITFLCGLGHVLSSVVLGAIGVAAGIAVGRLELIEGHRGDVAAYLMIAFGLVYLVWGLRRAIRNRPHTHGHLHEEGPHEHEHTHRGEHVHVHAQPKANITPWVLFTIFVFGPCEPLIPLLMYPAATKSAWGVALVAGVFALATIGTMMTVVLVASLGVNFLPMKRLERYTHALAGGAIALCGLAIVFGL